MLVPLRVGNLHVAGRCASMEHLGQSAARASGACFVMGQAAGTAAALRVGGRFSVGLLRQTLKDAVKSGLWQPDEASMQALLVLYLSNYLFLPENIGGMGARATKPGPSATCYPTGVAAVPIEIGFWPTPSFCSSVIFWIAPVGQTSPQRTQEGSQ